MSSAPPPIIDEKAVEALAAVAGLEVPAVCMPGVVENLALLAEHARRLEDEESLA
jgi:hypothetical protein